MKQGKRTQRGAREALNSLCIFFQVCGGKTEFVSCLRDMIVITKRDILSNARAGPRTWQSIIQNAEIYH